MTKITPLADHPDLIPLLIHWFRTQWPEHYASRSITAIQQDFHTEAQLEKIPIRLVALIENELAGTICLREQAISSAPNYSPGLGGLLVATQFRNRGVGTRLVEAGMSLAYQLQFEAVYATTIQARGILEKLGWRYIKTLTHSDEEFPLFSYKFCDTVDKYTK